MAYKNRFYKNFTAQNAFALIGTGVDYTAQTTLEGFINSAVEGEIGVFNAATNAALDGSAAITVPVFVALKRAGKIERSLDFNPTSTGNTSVTRHLYRAPAKEVHTVNTTPVAPVTGGVYGISLVETTAGQVPYNTWYYEIQATPGMTYTQAVTALVAKINSVNSYENKNRDKLVVAAIVSTDNITLTAVDFGVTFKVILKGALADTSTVSITTQMDIGNGTPTQVKLMEESSDIFKGSYINYPELGIPSEYTTLTSLVSASQEYCTYALKTKREEKTQTSGGLHHKETYIYIIVPSLGADGVNPKAELDILFGF